VALIASPNLTVDRTVRLARLEPGAVLRPRRAVVSGGSKGLNVARVLAALGSPGALVGFWPDEDEDLAGRLFGREPVEMIPVPIVGAMRVASIYLEDDGRITVLNEPGPDISLADWERLEAAIEKRLIDGSTGWLACSGSLPPGAPVDAYGRLVDLARALGVSTVVDAARDVLTATLSHEPDLVTPNLAEADAALGRSDQEAVDERGPDVPERALSAAGLLRERGARAAVVTAGAAGAAFDDGDGARWFPGVDVEVVSPIGAGDSFVGGLLHALEAGRSLVEGVAYGLATATASCEQDLAGGVDPDRVAELRSLFGAPTHSSVPEGPR
jgi:1-phosphofructokinase family hexose kinase